MRIEDFLALPLLLGCISCAGTPRGVDPDPWQKVEFDLSQLDADGLRGPPDGKVAMSYEFCIPNTAGCRKQVKSVDPTVQFMPGSRGRIGAASNQCLCIGSTHQRNWREVLKRLAALPYVERIIECHFE